MTVEEFRNLYIRLVESFHLDPETAQQILKRILEILAQTDGDE